MKWNKTKWYIILIISNLLFVICYWGNIRNFIKKINKKLELIGKGKISNCFFLFRNCNLLDCIYYDFCWLERISLASSRPINYIFNSASFTPIQVISSFLITLNSIVKVDLFFLFFYYWLNCIIFFNHIY